MFVITNGGTEGRMRLVVLVPCWKPHPFPRHLAFDFIFHPTYLLLTAISSTLSQLPLDQGRILALYSFSLEALSFSIPNVFLTLLPRTNLLSSFRIKSFRCRTWARMTSIGPWTEGRCGDIMSIQFSEDMVGDWRSEGNEVGC